MIDDLTMLANLPVVDAEANAQARAEADKAAASETMPPPKHRRAKRATDNTAARLARRGQDPPEQEKTGQEDS